VTTRVGGSSIVTELPVTSVSVTGRLQVLSGIVGVDVVGVDVVVVVVGVDVVGVDVVEVDVEVDVVSVLDTTVESPVESA
jgi:hypothetical protein